ncbi:response regulator [Paenibacillus aurantiacus]|uniref:Response regulator n=1 Tax=Paenibacillus aurantiacus TaxID=1936118 RepID=A0ABV5KW82_9BACL
MYKLLIADDEALEREGLEMMTRRMMPDRFLYYHAENGRKAIQLAEEHRPDFIFMDIKMPGIQGLEAIREIRKRHPHTRIILVTAHDYFAYAKEAVSLGVKEYLLKPAKREELLDVLNRMIAEKEEETHKRGEELEIKEKLTRLLPLVENEVTLMLMMDSVHDTDASALAEMTAVHWEKGYVMVLVFPYREVSWEALQQVRKELHESFKAFAKAQLPCMVSPMVGNRIGVMVPADSQGAGFAQRVDSVQWGERFLDFIEMRFGWKPVIGIGPVRDGIDGLRCSYQAAVAAAADSRAAARIRHSEDMRQSGGGDDAYMLEEERRLLDALARQQREEARARFTHLLDLHMGTASDDLVRARNGVAALLVTASRQLGVPLPRNFLSTLAEAEDEGMLRQTAFDQLELILAAQSAEREHRQSHVVERAKHYVKQRYKSDISMEQTAESVNLSPYYFSKVFKQLTGENFIDYLTRYRIEEAKRLLGDEALSFKEICYEVGYRDPNYFSRIFKKTTGVTPTEYRQQLS